MALKHVVDLDLDAIARVVNSLDPVNPQDAATKNYVDLKSIRYLMTATQSSTVVAPANLTQLTTGVLPVGTYAFRAYIKVRSATTGNGYGLRFSSVSATVSDIIAQWRLPANADFSTTHNIVYSQRLITDNNVAGTVNVANRDYMAVGEGTFTVSVAGTVAIQFRSETNGTAATAGIRSCLIVEPLT